MSAPGLFGLEKRSRQGARVAGELTYGTVLVGSQTGAVVRMVKVQMRRPDAGGGVKASPGWSHGGGGLDDVLRHKVDPWHMTEWVERV